jgi:hypothetical protein
VLQDGPRQVERPGQIDVHDAVPVLGGHLADGLVGRDAGVVDQDVQPPVRVHDLADHPLTVLVRPDVALVDGGPGVRPAEAVGGLLVARVTGREGDPAAGEPLADRRADAADTAGDQCYLAGHVCHVERTLPTAATTTGIEPRDG